ncbi:UNVERIFIED_CONTAM: ketopantoate reductase family protein, partial [Bacteroidetes bacterium 56_B9]
GSTIAFQLSQIGNHKITGIARPKSKRLEQLRQDDGILNTKNQKAQITTLDHLNPQIPYDLIIVTPLAHQAQPLLPVLQQSSAKCI